MDRNEMIDTIINDMQDWLKRDRDSFWEHVMDMERRYLSKMKDDELHGIYIESKS